MLLANNASAMDGKKLKGPQPWDPSPFLGYLVGLEKKMWGVVAQQEERQLNSIEYPSFRVICSLSEERDGKDVYVGDVVLTTKEHTISGELRRMSKYIKADSYGREIINKDTHEFYVLKEEVIAIKDHCLAVLRERGLSHRKISSIAACDKYGTNFNIHALDGGKKVKVSTNEGFLEITAPQQ